ncbi:MAG: branched-chain amino acid ABC transporter permease [Candidatus Caldarchaeum sp.]|nr:branched-chain amino acid ABC transporter permease [Candidatus Caldarchaeum sp.]MDW8435090.1 branched-chain amino acid ABC transporter permease [Candidatus Caldarchaeum sp.]
MVERISRPLGDDLRSNIVLTLALALAYPLVYYLSPGLGLVMGYGMTWVSALLGFNLLFGYGGLLSFGHALFLGLGAYTAGFLYKYLGINNIELHILGSVLSSLGIAALIGPLVVRYTKIFFAILMLAIAQVFWSLYYKFFWITGGTDGIKLPRFTIMGIPLEGLDFATYHHIYFYYVTALTLLLTYFMWRLVNSPFGLALRATRDNEVRSRFIGIDVYKMRLYAFVISAVYAGITGALAVNHQRLVTPDIAYWTTSGKVVFATLIGGSKLFIGPVIGSFVFHLVESFAMRFIYWQLIMGALVIIIIMFVPGGITQILKTPFFGARLTRRAGG